MGAFKELAIEMMGQQENEASGGFTEQPLASQGEGDINETIRVP